MSASIKTRQSGYTIIELVIAVSIIGILIMPATMVMLYFYGDTIKTNVQARLAVESENVLRSVVEELRVSSGVRASNTITDPNGPTGGWTTSNADLVLIISTPVTDTSNNYVIDVNTGEPYQNEIVYFADNNILYKRYLANAAAVGNRYKISCPAALSSATCPSDVVLSDNFKSMSFVFYDQDNAITTSHVDARSILLNVEMEQHIFGRIVTFTNNIRITLRNTI